MARERARVLLSALLAIALSVTGCTSGPPTDAVLTAPTQSVVLDTDGDHIPDSLEIELGLDPYGVDSDRDGRGDYHELYGVEPGGALLTGASDSGGPTAKLDYDGAVPTDTPLAETTQVPRDSAAPHLVAASAEPLASDGDGPLNALQADHDGDGINDGDVNDRDGDGVPDGWETNGWYVKSGVIMPYLGDALPAGEVYFTDPDQKSTDRDPFPDGVEGIGGLSVPAPGSHPLVPAVPEIIAHLTAVDVTLDQVIETESGGKSQNSWTNTVETLSTTTRTQYGDKTASAAKAVPYVGAASKAVSWIPGASKIADTFKQQPIGSISLVQTDDVKSTSEHRVTAVAGGLTENEWRTVTKTSLTKAAKVTLSVEFENVGLMDAVSVTPETTLLIAGAAASSGIKPIGTDGQVAVTDIGSGEKKSVALSTSITMGQLCQIQLGAPIGVQVDKLRFGNTTSEPVSVTVRARDSKGGETKRTVTYSPTVDWSQALSQVKNNTARIVVDRGDQGVVQTRVYATSLFNQNEDVQTLPMSVWHAMWCSNQAQVDESDGALQILVKDGNRDTPMTVDQGWTWYCSAGLKSEVAKKGDLNEAVLRPGDYAVLRALPQGKLTEVRNASFRKGACLVEAQAVSKLGISSVAMKSEKGGTTADLKAPTNTDPYYTLTLDPDYQPFGDEKVYALDVDGNSSEGVPVSIPASPGWDFDAMQPPTVILGKGLTEVKQYPAGTYSVLDNRRLSQALPAGWRLHSVALKNPNASPVVIESIKLGNSVFHPHQKAGDWVLGPFEQRTFRIGGYGKNASSVLQWTLIQVPGGTLSAGDIAVTWAPLRPPNVKAPTLQSIDCVPSWDTPPSPLGQDFINLRYYRASSVTIKNNDPKHTIVVYGVGTKENGNFSTLAWRDAFSASYNNTLAVSKYVEERLVVGSNSAQTLSWSVDPRPAFGHSWASQAWKNGSKTPTWLTWTDYLVSQHWKDEITWYDGPVSADADGWMYGPTITVTKDAWDPQAGKVLKPEELPLHYYAKEQLRTSTGDGR